VVVQENICNRLEVPNVHQVERDMFLLIYSTSGTTQSMALEWVVLKYLFGVFLVI